MTFKTASFVFVTPDGKQELPLVAEVAATEAEHERGLMFRTHLNANAGMIFTFGRPQVLNFWMKNTLIPLDVIFLDENMFFLSWAAMTPCKADPCALYPSVGPALYALEMPAGYVQEHGIGPGWRMEYVPE